MLNALRMGCLLAVCAALSCVPGSADEPLLGESNPANVRPRFVLQQEANVSTNAIAFSPDGKTLVTAGILRENEKNGGIVKVRVWEAQTGHLLRELKRNVPPNADLIKRLEDPLDLGNSLLASPLLLAYSPDGRTIAVSTGVISLWDARTGVPSLTLSWPQFSSGLIYEEFVTSVTFSPDNKTLVVGITSGYNQVRVFDVQTGKQLRVLPVAKYRDFTGGGSPVPVVLSPDGRLIATGGTTVRLWDAS